MKGRSGPGLRNRMGSWAIGMDFAWTVIGAVLLGLGADWLLGTSPIFLLIFMVAGLIGGFTVFLRAGLKASRSGNNVKPPPGDSASQERQVSRDS